MMELIGIGVILFAVLLDALIGEVNRYHPLVGFGNLASWLEKRTNRVARVNSSNDDKSLLPSALSQRCRGALAWALMVIPLPLIIVYWQIQLSVWMNLLLSIACLYFCLGWKSLREHGNAVATAFSISGIVGAREQVARIVSRDTDSMDESAVARATIESVLENGSDAVFAPLFWFAVLGPAAAIFYRLSNTLDAMWGYKTERFLHFGWLSAKMDDLLNFIPARLTALSYALLGDFRQAIRCWRRQASDCASPNGGPVMCAGAGALQVKLGGGAYYHGRWEERVIMGSGSSAAISDIGRSIHLIDKTLVIWLLAFTSIWQVGMW